jgi:hypothetical protein
MRSVLDRLREVMKQIWAYQLEQVESELFSVVQQQMEIMNQQMKILTQPGDHTTELSAVKRVVTQLRMSQLVLLEQRKALRRALEE